ncbi:MAG TPA: hypothetical protein VM557_00345 [Thermoanaerobaculia bacterium]|nr:hypothetical protein [Thermoanaerobaculia bacterium]
MKIIKRTAAITLTFLAILGCRAAVDQGSALAEVVASAAGRGVLQIAASESASTAEHASRPEPLVVEEAVLAVDRESRTSSRSESRRPKVEAVALLPLGRSLASIIPADCRNSRPATILLGASPSANGKASKTAKHIHAAGECPDSHFSLLCPTTPS